MIRESGDINERFDEMSGASISKQDIIMNYATPPGAEEIAGMAVNVMQNLPRELAAKCEELEIQIEEFPDSSIEQEMELETPYDLLALYRSGKEIFPGVQKKVANTEDCLILYRRPILDLWCETGEDLASLLREVIIEEIARSHEFSDADIQSFVKSA